VGNLCVTLIREKEGNRYRNNREKIKKIFTCLFSWGLAESTPSGLGMLGRTAGGGMPAGGAPRLGGTPGGGPGGGRTPAGATPGRCGRASEGTPCGRPGGGPGGRRMPAGGTPGRDGAAAPPPSMPGGPGSPSSLQERMFINVCYASYKKIDFKST
jgi:hypothetical protein